MIKCYLCDENIKEGEGNPHEVSYVREDSELNVGDKVEICGECMEIYDD